MHRYAALTSVAILGGVLLSSPALSDDGAPLFTPPSEEAFGVTREFFSYDQGIPLDARVVEQREIEGAVIEKIVFSGADGSRVPGYFAIPQQGDGPHACVILIHGLGGSKDDWWDPASFHGGGELSQRLLGQGVAVLTLDIEFHGERGASNDFESPNVLVFQRGWLHRVRDMVVRSVVEHRRAMDYLQTRAEIDTDRIWVLGYSLGGMMAFQLAALDDRVSAAVSCVSPILQFGPAAMRVQNYAPYIDATPFLMMIGDADSRNYAPEDARAVLDLIRSDDRDLISYESGHRLPEEWITESSDWLLRRIRD